jgi:hypothetical protein
VLRLPVASCDSRRCLQQPISSKVVGSDCCSGGPAEIQEALVSGFGLGLTGRDPANYGLSSCEIPADTEREAIGSGGIAARSMQGSELCLTE